MFVSLTFWNIYLFILAGIVLNLFIMFLIYEHYQHRPHCYNGIGFPYYPLSILFSGVSFSMGIRLLTLVKWGVLYWLFFVYYKGLGSIHRQSDLCFNITGPCQKMAFINVYAFHTQYLCGTISGEKLLGFAKNVIKRINSQKKSAAMWHYAWHPI